MNNKYTFGICVTNTLSLITNSSSELFVIRAKTTKEAIAAIINEALKDTFFKVDPEDIEERQVRDEYFVPPKLKGKRQPSKPKYYGVAFDRDDIWRYDNEMFIDVRSRMAQIGFEMIDGDY